MEIDHKIYRIQLKHTFGISRSKNDWYDIALIYIKDGDIIGRGEAAPSIRYNETTERIASILEKPIELPDDIDFSKGYILEKLVKLKKEISIIITRFGNNKYEIYEPIENTHVDQILKHSKILQSFENSAQKRSFQQKKMQ